MTGLHEVGGTNWQERFESDDSVGSLIEFF
jgi:hypothetical protein